MPSTVTVEGRKLAFPDDLDIDDKGNIYFSDASEKWDLATIYYLMTEYEGAGRWDSLRQGYGNIMNESFEYKNLWMEVFAVLINILK